MFNECNGSFGCTCDHYPPRPETLVSPPFNRELAEFWLSYELSVSALWDLLVSIWFGHDGIFYNLDRNPIDIWSHQNGDDFIDRLAGDPVRSLRRYLEFGQTTRVNRLRKEHHDLAMMLHHARSVRQCAHCGLCSQHRD